MHRLVTTADGSHSIFIPELDEHYHSVHGAVQESRHVFIEAGLKFIQRPKKEISLFEMGMGTGLNVFLTFLETEYPVQYTAIEAFPLDFALLKKINYVSQTGAAEYRELFDFLHTCPWNTEHKLRNDFVFTKVQGKLEDFCSHRTFDLVYYDAFAPRVQPELWTKEVFSKFYGMMNEGGILVTYCAKGEVKRNLEAAGFEVEALPGPPGKREMTRAKKTGINF